MATVLSVMSNKGGVGKTTSTMVLADLLAYLDKKVLCIDHDPQSNLSLAFHCFTEDEAVLCGRETPKQENIAELYKYRYRTKEEVQQLIQGTHLPNVSIIASSKRHSRTVLEVNSNKGNNNIILKKALKTIENDYDFILIDNAPANDILTINSIFASDEIIIPLRVEEFSYKGLKETLSDILYIKREYDLEGINFLGAFITQANIITKAFKECRELCIADLGEKFLKTSIRNDTKINEVESKMIPLTAYSAESKALIDYAVLLLEMGLLDESAAMVLRKSITEE